MVEQTSSRVRKSFLQSTLMQQASSGIGWGGTHSDRSIEKSSSFLNRMNVSEQVFSNRAPPEGRLFALGYLRQARC